MRSHIIARSSQLKMRDLTLYLAKILFLILLIIK